MKKLFITFIVLFAASIFAQENYKKVEVFFQDKADIKALAEKGIPVDDGFITKDESIVLFVTEEQFEQIQEVGLKYRVLIDNWEEHFKNRDKLTLYQKEKFISRSREEYGVKDFDFGSMAGYYTMQEVYDELDYMHENYGDIISGKVSIGESLQGRDNYISKISDNPYVDEDEPEVFLNSLIHAREPQGMMTLIYYMYYLLENYGTDPEVTHLVDNREIYFLPIINVDGYKYNIDTNPNGGGMWRKNRRDNGNGSYGVDLNRNWGYEWGYDNGGSSPYPSSPTYRGTAPFSEPTNQVVKEFCEEHNFKTALNYHTYSNLLIVPWGYINQQTTDSAIFKGFAADMTAYNGYTYGTSGEILYPVNGATDDWMYGEQESKNKIISMTPEVGGYNDGFWPEEDRIFPLAQENLRPNLYITWAAGGFVNFVNKQFSQSEFNPGDEVELTATVKNKGLSDAENLLFQLNAVSDNASIIEGEHSLDFLESRTSKELEHTFKFKVDGSANVNEVVELEFISFTGNAPMSRDTIRLNVGTPVAIFNDNAESLSNWNVTGGNGGTEWTTTNSEYYSPDLSFTESPNGNYGDNAQTSMTLTNSISIPANIQPILSFWTKFDIEDGWDCGQIKISSDNGASWQAIGGVYATVGSGDGAQPEGEPVYDGQTQSWVYENIDLSGYSGEQIKLRFTFSSDSYLNRDGWYIDDIKLFHYTIVPVELNSFTANAVDAGVKLNWITGSELNNMGFEIVRSQDKKEWQKIGFVEGNGTTNEKVKYSYLDKSPNGGNLFYRLVQIDFDGTKKTFDPVEVTNETLFKFNLKQNYPNPFNPVTKIKYAIPGNQNVVLTIYSALGEKVATVVDKYQEAGKYELNLSSDALNLSSGIYYYQLKSGNYSKTKKMIVLQ